MNYPLPTSTISDSRFNHLSVTIQSSPRSLFPAFRFIGAPHIWLPQLRDTLTEYRLKEQQQIQQERREAWQSWVRDTWALNTQKDISTRQG